MEELPLKEFISLDNGYEIGTDVYGHNDCFYNLHQDSITLGGLTGLFMDYARLKRGDNLDIPKETEEFIYRLFEIKERMGIVTNDAIDYGNNGLFREDKDYRDVRFVIKPAGFVEENGVWKINGGEEHFTRVPKWGYVEYTCDGLYDDLGIPFSTKNETDKNMERRIGQEKAIESWIAHGYDKDIARKLVSYWCPLQGPEVAAVVRWPIDGRGPLSIGASSRPDRWDAKTGYLPARELKKDPELVLKSA